MFDTLVFFSLSSGTNNHSFNTFEKKRKEKIETALLSPYLLLFFFNLSHNIKVSNYINQYTGSNIKRRFRGWPKTSRGLTYGLEYS